MLVTDNAYPRFYASIYEPGAYIVPAPDARPIYLTYASVLSAGVLWWLSRNYRTEAQLQWHAAPLSADQQRIIDAAKGKTPCW